MKTTTIALIVTLKENSPILVEVLYDKSEIQYFEYLLQTQSENPLIRIYDQRGHNFRMEEDFANYIEDLLTQTYPESGIRSHGLQWFNTKMKLDCFRETEREAALTIANYAFQLFRQDRSQTQYLLKAPGDHVQIQVFTLPLDLFFP